MALELIYTSAPAGLIVGSRGFCTVACSEGMPRNYVELCESLSGYVHVYAPHQPEYATKSPVAFSHYQFLVGGKLFAVLSRVACYGVDYTGRTNNLAHHVMVPDNGWAVAGPGAVMLSDGFFTETWDGEPRQLRGVKRVPVPAAGTAGVKGVEWERLSGDAGWAGVLAQKYLRNPEQVLYFTYPPGLPLLPLLAEILVLLPPPRRWQVTFSTYFSQVPRGSSCLWRGCLTGSVTAQQALRVPGVGIVDLSEPLGPCGSGPLVDAARSGREPDWVAVEHWLKPGGGGAPAPVPGPVRVTADGAAAETPAAAVPVTETASPPSPVPGTAVPTALPEASPRSTWFAYALLLTGLLAVVWLAWAFGREPHPAPVPSSAPLPRQAPAAGVTPPRGPVSGAAALPVPVPTASATGTESPVAAADVPPASTAVATPGEFVGETRLAVRTLLPGETRPAGKAITLAALDGILALESENVGDRVRVDLADGCRLGDTQLVAPKAVSGFTGRRVQFVSRQADGTRADGVISFEQDVLLSGTAVPDVRALVLQTRTDQRLVVVLQPAQLPAAAVSVREGVLRVTVPEAPAWLWLAVAAADPATLEARDPLGGTFRVVCKARQETERLLVFAPDQAQLAASAREAQRLDTLAAEAARRGTFLGEQRQRLLNAQPLTVAQRHSAATYRPVKRQALVELFKRCMPLFEKYYYLEQRARRLVDALYADMLDDTGLPAAVRDQVKRLQASHKFSAAFEVLLTKGNFERAMGRLPMEELFRFWDEKPANVGQASAAERLRKLNAIGPDTALVFARERVEVFAQFLASAKLDTQEATGRLEALVSELLVLDPGRSAREAADLLARSADQITEQAVQRQKLAARFRSFIDHGYGLVATSSGRPLFSVGGAE